MSRLSIDVPRVLVVAAVAVAAAVVAVAARATVAPTLRWGNDGHVMVALTAVEHLPADMPEFFRDSREQLGWLSYDPDRWRNDDMTEANEAWQYDHFIDLEAVPVAALAERSRFRYLSALEAAGIEEPENMGLLPFRIIELTQRLTQGFRQWREATDPQVRQWLEQRIVDDAGILGHYVADGANPHHTTIHFNGWSSDAPNPDGFTLDRTFHRRFESDFVSTHIRVADVAAVSTAAARVLDDLRTEVMAYVRDSNGHVRRLYELEEIERFSNRTSSAAHRDFTIGRLAAGADMLRSIWYTAWRRSDTT